jgi:peptidoglycan/xylan/chitin deacetylase (PgdA/CDA1 family)
MIKRTLAALVLLIVVLGALLSWSYSSIVITLPVSEKVVALTYDDGPNPPYTQELLALLAQHGVRATFFLKGRNVEAFPDAVRAIARAGHEIGNHSYSHQPMVSLNKSKMLAEIIHTNQLIEQLGVARPLLFRPPYGLQGPGLKRALAELGMTSVAMSDAGFDWEVTDPQTIAGNILRDIGPGSIVLLHDGHGDVDNPQAQDSRAPTVAATAILIEALTGMGYRFVTVGDALAEADPALP